MLKLNNKGFGLHIILPILALLAVGSIGAYMTFKSSAAVPPEGWKTVKTRTGPWTYSVGSGPRYNDFTVSGNGSIRYRFCAVIKFSSYSDNRIDLFVTPSNIDWTRPTIGTSYKTVCTTSERLSSGSHYPNIQDRRTHLNKYTVSKIYWQRYY